MAALTTAEWDSIRDDFPNLARADCRKTGEATEDYNCIAFTLNIFDDWIDPPEAQADFELLYTGAPHNFVVCPRAEGTIDGWAGPNEDNHDIVEMTHGSKFTTAWESKIGENIRITHPRGGLASTPTNRSLYGNIVVSFKRPAVVVGGTATTTVTTTGDSGGGGGGGGDGENKGASGGKPADTTSSSGTGVSGTGSTDEIAHIVTALKDAFGPVTDEFGTKYLAWKKTWFSSAMRNKQKSSARAQGKEWDALVAMTSKILPEVVNKLKSPREYFAVQLYNKLQTDQKKKVSRKDIQNFYSLKNQSKKIIQLYSTLVVAPFDSNVSEWEAHQRKKANSSKSGDYLDSDAYRALVAMGKDEIVPLVMVEYSKDQGGWWHELLYELEHGKKSGASHFKKEEEYQKWKKWFEGSGRTGGEAAAAA